MPIATGYSADFDPSDSGTLFTTYVASGVHTGTPGDGDRVQVQEEKSGGSVSDLSMEYSGGADSAPHYRSGASSGMPLACLDYGSTHFLESFNQDGSSVKGCTAFMGANNLVTLFGAIRPEVIDSAASNVWESDCVVGDKGGTWGVYLRTEGGTPKICFYGFDSAPRVQSLNISVNTDNVFWMIISVADGKIKYGLNSTSGSQFDVSPGTIAVAGPLVFGKALTGGSSGYDGKMGRISLWPTELAGSDFTNTFAQYDADWRTGGGLTEKFRIPTTAPDGTTRKMWVFTNTTLATPLVSDQTVVASGGFFTLTSAAGVVGQTYPAFLATYGADATENAFGGPCWATVIEE